MPCAKVPQRGLGERPRRGRQRRTDIRFRYPHYLSNLVYFMVKTYRTRKAQAWHRDR